MGKFVRRLCWPAGFAFGTLGALLSACPGDKGGAVDTAGCSPEEEPGYGTLGLSYVMADEYTESIREGPDEPMNLWVYHVDEAIESCDPDDYNNYDYLFSVDTGLTYNAAYQVPAGSTCANTAGYVIGSSTYDVACGGHMELTNVPECSRVDTTIVVTCRQVPTVDQGD